MKIRNKTRHFTLIEMIAVVAIASMLIGIFVPAFNRMLFGSKVDQAAANFKLGLEIAQSRAISARKYVAMIIPCDISIADARLKKYCLGGYRLAYVKKNGKDWEFSSWIPDSSWRNPDDGARLVRMDTGDTWSELLKRGANTLSDNDLLPYVAKEKSSELTKDGEDKINLLEIGEYEKSGSLPVDEDLKLLGNAQSSYKEHNLTAIIFSPFGGILNSSTNLDQLRFFFTETKIAADGSAEYPNQDNIVVLTLNPLTGRVEYLVEED